MLQIDRHEPDHVQHVEPPLAAHTPAEPAPVVKPDGVPHDIIGILAFMTVLTAMAIMFTYLFAGPGPAIVVGAVVTLFVVVHLSRRSARERTEESA